MIEKLMITAHPDDEALFGGAELLTHADEYKSSRKLPKLYEKEFI